MSNFLDLYKKIQAISEAPAMPIAPTKDDGAGAGDSYDNVEECGDMPMPMPIEIGGHQGEEDHVSMNINMSGNGAGGIRDLMNILKDIDNVAEPHSGHDSEGPSPEDLLFGVEEEGFGNAQAGAPGPETMPVASVTPTGNDLASKGKEARKVNGGGNPLKDDLASKLAELYQSIKEAKEEKFDPLKHVKNPTKGEKEAAKDVKRGSYADRAAMLKSAEADGRLKD